MSHAEVGELGETVDHRHLLAGELLGGQPSGDAGEADPTGPV
jgi:hypothetical protein